MTALETGRPSGLQVMEAIRDGTLAPPPAALVFGLDLTVAETGRVVFEFQPHERFSNWIAVHGGVLAGVADFALTAAVITTRPPGGSVVTTNLNLSYLRPVALDAGTVRCEGRLVHAGRTLAHAEATMTGADGVLLLRATATCRLGG